MKKVLVAFLILLSMPVVVYAQERGALTNVWASWVSVSGTQTTLTLPSNSRDIWVQNGSAVDICISLTGETIQNNCYVNTPNANHHTFQMDGPSDIHLFDYITGSVSFRSATGAAASPVSVVVTY